MATAVAMTVAASAQQGAAKVESVLMLSKGNPETLFIVGATDSELSVMKNAQAAAAVKYSRKGVKSIFMRSPKAFDAAMELYEGRKYAEAQQRFSEVKEKYSALSSLAGNHSTLAAFYEIECMRKQLDLKGLVDAVATFDAGSLTGSARLKQVEVYKFWELVHKKDWARVDALAAEWEKKSLPVTLRAQVAYCRGLALEGLNKPADALNAFAEALTADFTKSEEISRGAVHAALRVYGSLPEVREAQDSWGTEDENPQSNGYKMLIEANSLARLYESAGLGAGVKLPAKQAAFLDFTPASAN